MKLVLPVLIAVLFFCSCKKNEEKILGEWKLKQYVEFDSLGDRKYGFSYSELCPFKIFEVKENTWSSYDMDCNGTKTAELGGYYDVDEDTLFLEGFDLNGELYFQHFVFRKLNKRKLHMDLLKTKTGTEDWEWVDVRYFEYNK